MSLDLSELKEVKVNLGCGTLLSAGYINIDIRNVPGVIQSDVKNLDHLFNDNTIDEITAYDVLEHFPFMQIRDILSNWIRKLKPGGKIVVRVPDLEKILNRYVTKKLPFFEAQRLIFGGQDYAYNFHYVGFTEGVLEGYLLGCGCSEVIQVVREDTSHNVTLVARK
jgi:predicted SAM-dependent methyltransferase